MHHHFKTTMSILQVCDRTIYFPSRGKSQLTDLQLVEGSVSRSRTLQQCAEPLVTLTHTEKQKSLKIRPFNP